VIRHIAALCGTNALYGNSKEIAMSIRGLLLVAAFAFASLGAAHAGGMRPIEAKSIDLGEVAGVACYTVERDGLHVVTTLAQGETGIPIRVVSVLAPGQSVVLSTPHASGAIEISRKGDSLLVRKATAVAEAMPQTSNPTGHDRVSMH
jgi:hypothetical protein